MRASLLPRFPLAGCWQPTRGLKLMSYRSPAISFAIVIPLTTTWTIGLCQRIVETVPLGPRTDALTPGNLGPIDPGHFGPDLGRFGPDLGRFGPDPGRFGPDPGRFGPDRGPDPGHFGPTEPGGPTEPIKKPVKIAKRCDLFPPDN